MRSLAVNVLAIVFAPLLALLFMLWLFARPAPRTPRITVHRGD